ncbi:MAG TPA: YlxR family protein [Chloroflexaceae bacterium]|nr:YlxR family protein [Chloroflexaceae bacterium]
MTERGNRQAPRPRHIPQRTCVACRRGDAKRQLVRVVRDGEGRVAVDPGGRRNGRGAYLCHDPTCWEQALKRKALERALRVEALHPDDRAALLAFASGLTAPVEPAQTASPQEAS